MEKTPEQLAEEARIAEQKRLEEEARLAKGKEEKEKEDKEKNKKEESERMEKLIADGIAKALSGMNLNQQPPVQATKEIETPPAPKEVDYTKTVTDLAVEKVEERFKIESERANLARRLKINSDSIPNFEKLEDLKKYGESMEEVFNRGKDFAINDDTFIEKHADKIAGKVRAFTTEKAEKQARKTSREIKNNFISLFNKNK